MKFFCFLVLASTTALGHGEDKPGPHGGYIRMPGAFHVEIVPREKDRADIYLLDLEWKNPTVNGKIAVKLGANKPVKCEAGKGIFFSCVFPQGSDLAKKGKLTVTSEREGQRGNDVVYDLPLKHEPMHSSSH